MSKLLFLNVLTYQGKPPADALSHVFDAGGGTVGRSSNNQLRLPDPEGFISRKHGKIEFEDDDFSYTDTSSGGTYFVARDLLLEHDSLLLRDGDILRIGEYEIAVSMLDHPIESAAQPLSHASGKSSRSKQRMAVGSAMELFESFLDGAGLEPPAKIKSEQLPGMMKSAGALFRALAEGVLALSRTRPTPPGATSLPAKHSANPLSNAETLNEGLELLLFPEHPDEAISTDAIRSGFCEILNHRVAMNGALQAELAVALRRFDPAGIEQLFGAQGKAQCWEAFRKAYPELVNDIVENFFGEEFAKIYERQLRLLQSVKPR